MRSRRSKARYFYKRQTAWVMHPATLDTFRGDSTIGIGVRPEHRPGEMPNMAVVYLLPNEAMAFAAWLGEQAEHLIAKEARAEARREARRQKKLGGAA